MLTFTHAGVVAAPEALQVRLADLEERRVRVGAPRPSRRLSDAELSENLRWFTEGMRGPRGRPVHRLVLTGIDRGWLASLPPHLAGARAWGVTSVVLHLGEGAVDAVPAGVDAVVVHARVGGPPPVLPRGAPATVAIELDDVAPAALVEAVRAALGVRPARVLLVWPFPPAGRPAPPARAASILDAVRGEAEDRGVVLEVTGLPPCLLGPTSPPPRRARNRWYVDADHQLGAALRFFPDVMRFAKADSCRFCRWDARCDGVAEAWWREPHVVLEPVQDGG